MTSIIGEGTEGDIYYIMKQDFSGHIILNVQNQRTGAYLHRVYSCQYRPVAGLDVYDVQRAEEILDGMINEVSV